MKILNCNSKMKSSCLCCEFEEELDDDNRKKFKHLNFHNANEGIVSAEQTSVYTLCLILHRVGSE